MGTEDAVGTKGERHPFVEGQDMLCKLCLWRNPTSQTDESRLKAHYVDLLVVLLLITVLSLVLAGVTMWLPMLWGTKAFRFVDVVAFWMIMWFLFFGSFFVIGKSRFIFQMDGKKHVHEKDPRKQLLPTGKFVWIAYPADSDPPVDVSVIQGPILRIRHFGWLIKFWYWLFDTSHAYNGFLDGDSNSVSMNLRLTDGSTIDECWLKDVPNLPWGIRTAGQMLDFVIQYGSLSGFLYSSFQLHQLESETSDLVLAIREYVLSSRDRSQSSSVGRHVRKLIEVSDYGQKHPNCSENSQRGRKMLDALEGRMTDSSNKVTS